MDEIKTNLILRMKQNPMAAAAFAVDNNPFGSVEQLKKMGYTDSFNGTPEQNVLRAKQIILSFTPNRPDKVQEFFNNVNYLNDDESSAAYTKGFKDYFLTNTPTNLVDNANYKNDSGRFSFDGLLAALGTGLTTYSNVSNAQSGTTLTPTQIQQQQAEAEAKRKRTMWGWIIGGIAGIGVITIIVIAVTGKKKEG
jgi:hypothetical protein